MTSRQWDNANDTKHLVLLVTKESSDADSCCTREYVGDTASVAGRRLAVSQSVSAETVTLQRIYTTTRYLI